MHVKLKKLFMNDVQQRQINCYVRLYEVFAARNRLIRRKFQTKHYFGISTLFLFCILGVLSCKTTHRYKAVYCDLLEVEKHYYRIKLKNKTMSLAMHSLRNKSGEIYFLPKLKHGNDESKDTVEFGPIYTYPLDAICWGVEQKEIDVNRSMPTFRQLDKVLKIKLISDFNLNNKTCHLKIPIMGDDFLEYYIKL